MITHTARPVQHPRSPRQIFLAACVCTLFCLLTPCSSAQTQRLELGRRLKRFEIAWEQAPATQQAKAVAPLKQAVSSFFSLQLSEAGRQLDNAWFTVRNDAPPSATEKVAIAYSLTALPFCAAPETTELKLQLSPFYTIAETLPENTTLNLLIKNNSAETLAKFHCPATAALVGTLWNTGILPPGDHHIETTLQFEGLSIRLPDVSISRIHNSAETLAKFHCPATAALVGTLWNTGILPPGDHHIETTLQFEDLSIRLPDVSISRIPDLARRTEKLQQSADRLRQQALAENRPPELPPTTLTAATTARNEAALLKAASEDRSTEADFPLLARLLLAEQLAENPQLATEIAARSASQNDLWLTLAKGRKSVPVRLKIPATTDPQKKLPVLFVFHGAGGSENMFFETYGAGRAITEATRRGWLVVAPGQGLLGLSLSVSDMLDNLQHFANIDRSQVMLLGHSMGAAQVMRQMQQDPYCALAAAALGGGSRMSAAAAATLKPVKWYVAAGTEDFGRGGALQLHRSLTTTGVTSEYHDFPDVEHLVIVQAALSDVFRFLDQSLSASINQR